MSMQPTEREVDAIRKWLWNSDGQWRHISQETGMHPATISRCAYGSKTRPASIRRLQEAKKKRTKRGRRS